jgi:hypothetical protein
VESGRWTDNGRCWLVEAASARLAGMGGAMFPCSVGAFHVIATHQKITLRGPAPDALI